MDSQAADSPNPIAERRHLAFSVLLCHGLGGLVILVFSLPIALVVLLSALVEKVRVGHTTRVERAMWWFLNEAPVGFGLGALLLPIGLVLRIISPLERARYGQLTGGQRVVSLMGIGCAILAAPFVLSDYRTFQLAQAAAYILIVFGLNILTGYTGQLSLGHGAFALLGGYFVALAVSGKLGGGEWNVAAAVLAAGVFTGALGLMVGFPSLRLSGPYLGLVTLALAVSIPILLRSHYAEPFGGGPAGMMVAQAEVPAWVPSQVNSGRWNYYLIVLPTVVLLGLGYNLLRGGYGRAFKAVRDSEIGAQAIGISLKRQKLMAFALSAFYSGVGGGFLISLLGFVNPDSFTVIDSINFLTAVVLGGLGSFLGSILGGCFLTLQSDLNGIIASFIPGGEELRWAIYGTMVILVVLIAPQGMASKLYRK